MNTAPGARTAAVTTDRKHVLRALGDLSAAVAQELRAPVVDIASAAQLLRFRAHGDPVLEKSVGRILRDAERLNRIVAALLDFGRPEPLKLAPGDPDDVWDTVIAHHQGTLEARALVLHRTRAHPAARCPIDRDQLAKAFELLLVNAAGSAPDASDLQLTASVDQNGTWEGTLTSRGAPIPEDAIGRVFGVFYSTSAGEPAVGLALCQRIVAEHNGAITVESGEPTGTAITVAIPAA